MSQHRYADWRPGYYDDQAATYDESRGGEERAEATVAAVARLGPDPGRHLDVAGGTGVVAAGLHRLGWSSTVVDLSPGMLAVANRRLPGRAVLGSADRLPVADGSVDLVTIIWMLNLIRVEVVDAVLAESARVLAPGGRLVITVDKELAHDPVFAGEITDGDERVGGVLADHGLVRAGSTTFSGRSPWGSATDGDPVFRLAAFERPA